MNSPILLLTEASYVPAVWAGRKISYLIDQIRAHGESDEMIAEIVALSQQYGIQTPYTSWLVVPERQELVARHLRSVPDMPRRPPGPGRRGIQGERLRRLGIRANSRGPASGGFGGGGGFGDSDGTLDLWLAADAVLADAGEAANIIARKNVALKELRSRDEDRLDLSRLPVQQFSGRWYNRIGQYLVDEAVDEETQIIVVRFGSEAYFELAVERADLRAVLAASRKVVVLAGDAHALLIADEEGIEQFSDDQREQFGLVVR